jgi:hypothetical protein
VARLLEINQILLVIRRRIPEIDLMHVMCAVKLSIVSMISMPINVFIQEISLSHVASVQNLLDSVPPSEFISRGFMV